MDGTLIADGGIVSQRNLNALRAAHDAGIHVVVATGRRHSFAMSVLRPLALPHTCTLVSSNGTVTRTFGACPPAEPVASKLIARTHLPRETALWLCAHIGEFRNALVLTFDRVGANGDDTRGALVVEHLDELNSSIGRWMTANEPYIAHIDPIEAALNTPGDAPIQGMLCGTIERMRRAEARLLEHSGVIAVGHTPDTVEPHHQVALHRTEYPARDLSILDILPAGCSKGAAILALAATHGIAPSQILAIGDNWNDVSMLEIAGTAVLMDNAPDDLKAVARARGWRIGPSNNHDGVAEAIESALAVPTV